MTAFTDLPRLTELSHGAGCACKLSMDELRDILGHVTPPQHPDLVVGFDTGDDAAVWRRADGSSLVATTDFFTPLVDDARTWGRIAAANAASDVYAMGGTPLFALNVVGWPRTLSFDVLGQVLEGAGMIANEAGYVVVGGHSIDSREPFFGQAVIGEVGLDRLLTNAGAIPGQALVLTKAIGSGVVMTAVKRSDPDDITGDGPLAVAYDEAVRSMTRLNRDAARVAVEAGATAATDITGFGLLGHLHRLALASQVAAEIDAAAVPLLQNVADLCEEGFVPGGTKRNHQQAGQFLTSKVTGGTSVLLADAQTSGGLLFACDPAAASAAVETLAGLGHTTAVIGRMVDGSPGSVTVW